MQMSDVIVINYGLHYPYTVLTSFQIPHSKQHLQPSQTSGDALIHTFLPACRAQKTMSEYRQAMKEMFEHVAPFAATPGKAFIFRETAAEHRHIFSPEEEAQYDPEDRRVALAPRLTPPRCFDEQDSRFVSCFSLRFDVPSNRRELGCRCRQTPDTEMIVQARNAVIHDLLKECVPVAPASFRRHRMLFLEDSYLHPLLAVHLVVPVATPASYPDIQLVPMYNLTVPLHDLHEGPWCARARLPSGHTTLAELHSRSEACKRTEGLSSSP